MSRLKKAEIIKKLIEFIKKEGGISVDVAAEMFGISEVTARRYLNELAKIDSLPFERVRGGLILKTGKGSIEFMFETKMSLNIEEKKKIAEKAASFVDDGDSLVIDSGTTTFQMARYLRRKKGLKVITVDVKIAEELAKNPEIETYIIGGKVRPGYFSIGGEMAVNDLSMFSVEKVFMSADAVNLKNGITNSSMFEAYVKKTLMKLGKKVFLLADHTKFGKEAFVHVADLNDVDVIITSSGIDDECVRELEDLGKDVFVV